MKRLKGILVHYLAFGGLFLHMVACSGSSPVLSKSTLRDSSNYKIQPGDVLEIHFAAYSEFNQVVVVNSQGRVSLRVLGELKVAELTLGTFEKLLKNSYANWLEEPEIKVSVKPPSHFTIYVGGEVREPGIVRFRGKLTVAQAILLAGGLKDKTRDFVVTVYRNGGAEGVQTYKFELEDKRGRRMVNSEFELQPYDIIIVKQSAKTRTTSGKLI